MVVSAVKKEWLLSNITIFFLSFRPGKNLQNILMMKNIKKGRTQIVRILVNMGHETS